MLMREISVFIALFLAASVYAGGDNFPVHITYYEGDGYKFKFTASVSEERKWMDMECEKIYVSGEYDKLKWAKYKRPMSEENHMLALSYLEKASISKKKIYLGYLGSGLHRVAKCTYISKGLIFENYGKPHVMSVHGSI
ncbi:hypothetical protein BTJ40_16395 [Microbulbifer sp. A4B17]|uniref:hypothetical protein n=1 Tax=Microbulbifer sp. A4B17 TaxID=359370 RepID=UPI000D52BA77|nr:hypothetical protein [Microbulbifer sp. A4B17]AWF82279.1 hypothetical protein BTJ40_16395 [Microbulbifer sp. A4B17]